MLSNADFLRDDNNIPNPDDEESETDDHIEERNWSTDTEQYTLSEEENNEDPSFNYYIGKDQKTKWKKALPPKNVRTRSENIITHLPGVKGEVKNAKSILDCWNLFIDDNILECIVTNTNIYIRNIQQNYSRERDANLTNLHEIKALLGIIYFLGVMKANKLNTDDAWARDSTGFELCRIAMSENRFRFLLRVIRFDDKATRNERLCQDKFAAVRLILDTFVKNCQKHYSPSEYITVDEKLDAFRGKCNFRQYIPSKHNKYGIKLFALVDSKMFYTCNLEIYSGKNPEGPYNVSNSPSDVVERLCEPIKGTGRNVTMDNWFTSYSLALKLLQQYRLTIVGTLKRNKKEIPSEFVISRGRNVHTSVFGFQSEMTLLSYKSKENKVVLMLSTLHHDANIDDSTGELKKPEMIMFYNMTKGGVDMMDEMTATYNCARNSRRWPMVIFYSLLNIGAINSQIIHFANGNASKVKSRRHFLKTLSLDLIEEMVKVRTIHTKSSVFTFSAETFQDLSEWMTAIQKVAFGMAPSPTASASATTTNHVQNEENQVYSSLNSQGSLRCSLKGEYLLVVNATSITLTELAGRILYVWHFRHIRRYGCSKDVFSFEAGRKSPSGEGLFSFHAADGNLIFQTVDGLVNQLKTAAVPIDVPAKPPRRGKASNVSSRSDHLYEDPQSVASEPDYANLDEPQYGHLSTEPRCLYANVNDNPVPHILHNDTEYAQVKKVAKNASSFPLLKNILKIDSICFVSKVFWIVFDFYLLKKMDQRTCIKFCVKNEIKCADAFRMLTVAYGEATLDRSNIYRWYKMFSEGREDVNDEERAGRPSTSTTDEKINEVEKMILANRRITVREVAEDLNISIGSCHSIFIND
ncbi:hypothetical protein LAZ67_9002121 [Cordylochernes scorpioides]|uniref:IRS-type PTB domain-containing protein n=1 Tax=Cordylochernes scorpioides TaxID=51811 RepID=A0ABY6KU22_9ARAC|nr:hypothetical protein LAZ67_9002121 [Cordylochernes scorpioides]